MKKISILFAISLLFLFPSSVLAQKFNNDDHAYLSQQETVNGDYFPAGDKVTISGTVNGDVYTAANTIIIDGTVNGDVLALGAHVTISGSVSDDVRVLGGDVTISGDIGKNLTIGTAKGTITSEAHIGGSIVGGASSLMIMSPVGKNAVIGGETLVLGNVIQGNVIADAETLTLNTSASISGNLTYTSENEVILEKGASVQGQIQRDQSHVSQKNTKQTEFAGKFIWEAITFCITFLFGVLFLFFTPTFFQNIVQSIASKPLPNLGIGFLVFIISPILLLLVCLTLIGIPFAIIGLFVFIIDILIAKIFVAYLIGERVHEAVKFTTNKYLTFLTGLFIYKIISFIPVIGALMGMVATLIGLGALITQKRDTYKLLRSKNEI